MSHSVRSHLRLEIDAYDATIRRFIPGYEEGLRRAAREIAGVQPGLVLDLGAGTGALSEAILAHDSVEALEAVDVDPEMLAQARARLQRFGARARFRECSFDEPLPSCDAVAASLALHHVPTMDAKGELFRRIHRALRPGGVFVNADVTISADPAERDRAYRLWANHMTGCGIEEEQAWQHFDEWAEEDTYFPMEDELAAMREAGFRADCIWRCCPNSLLVGRKG
ncbi:MAG: class I SAM-dependent methyltransferase [Gammaproteobacteria bacterium]|nr:class I SAM-dependent methyltransferase [Gammaproteobacteria bacterium]